jgi:hypothetical protein
VADWGLEPLGAQGRHDVLENLEDRYGRRSTIVTSQLPIADWHIVIGEATFADAISTGSSTTLTASNSVTSPCAAIPGLTATPDQPLSRPTNEDPSDGRHHLGTVGAIISE